MFGIEVDSWEKLVSEFADMLDSSNMEAWPYVDLTDQRVGVHVDLNWGDPTCEEPLTKFVFGRGAEVKTGALVKAFGGSQRTCT